MKLEQQVCSLELAKKLKELGVKQESLYFWNKKGGGLIYRLRYFPSGPIFPNENISAFTVAELGEMLPVELWGKVLYMQKMADGDAYIYYDENVLGFSIDKNRVFQDQSAPTEADARAKMLIYLLENKLLD